jgi:hypothetical protein
MALKREDSIRLREDSRMEAAARADEHGADGEVISIAERLIVSPAWGRLRTEPLAAGQELQAGTVVGCLEEAGDELPLVCHTASVFLAWLVPEGERVPPGKPVARLLAAGP